MTKERKVAVCDHTGKEVPLNAKPTGWITIKTKRGSIKVTGQYELDLSQSDNTLDYENIEALKEAWGFTP